LRRAVVIRIVAYNAVMGVPSLHLYGLREALAKETLYPIQLARQALGHSNSNAGRNTYLWQDFDWTLREAANAASIPRGKGGMFDDGRSLFWGLPVSIKDCFDLAGTPTTCGVRFYRELHGPAASDSWVAEKLRAAGAIITGKTHLHPLAYGITGENPEFGDCQQPGDSSSLTGGSSSGAAASVLEGSAVAAIGTDTGGSIRAPAALCGLAGYRASLGRGDWRGAAHLAQSFDTMGWLYRNLEDGPLLAGFFAPDDRSPRREFTRFAAVNESFLHDCEPEIASSLLALSAELEALGLRGTHVDVSWWAESFKIFAPIQAWEAARIHAGYFHHFEPSIRERLEWGARIADSEISSLRERHLDFQSRMDALLVEHELLVLPASPVARLAAGADHSSTRTRLLRYTTPFSLAGIPVVTIPCAAGGMQLAASRGFDESLLVLTARLGARRKLTASSQAS
jgi:Asp-tRNA(Asn)/Glu-tRNA(Gln) amidotransferase A subunit family amidase